MNGSIKEYLDFIEKVKGTHYPVRVKFGLAHPDSIKCFGYTPDFDLSGVYNELSTLLCKHGMYAENSGGLRLNYSPDLELGLNAALLSAFKMNNVHIETASNSHKQSDTGANILELENMLK